MGEAFKAPPLTDAMLEAAETGLQPEGVSIDFNALSIEEMQKMRDGAVQSGNVALLESLLAQARLMDGWDDTDPRLGHLVGDLSNDIQAYRPGLVE